MVVLPGPLVLVDAGVVVVVIELDGSGQVHWHNVHQLTARDHK